MKTGLGLARWSLRTRFLLVLVGGAILPLGATGYWLTRTSVQSGERLLRDRMEGSLQRRVEEIGRRWPAIRSRLIDVADNLSSQTLLTSPAPTAPADLDLPDLDLQEAGIVELALLDTGGARRWSPPRDPDRRTLPSPTLAVEVPVFKRGGGGRIGTIAARVRLAALLVGAETAGIAGAVLGVFEPGGETSVVPLPMTGPVMRERRFEWSGETWVSERRLVTEPPIELILAAPVEGFEQPFAAATRRGTLALILVTLASFSLATLLTNRLTASLARIAAGADAVAAGELDRRVPVEGSRELAGLARAFNTMTENLQRTLRRLSQQESLAAVGEFAASLAHEVRNPLSSIRVDLQVAEEKTTDAGPVKRAIRRALQTVERLNATVSGALQVARSGRIGREPFDLFSAVTAAIHGAEPELKRRGIEFTAVGNGIESLVLLGDPAALEQALLNLLINAAQAADGGRVELAIEQKGIDVRITIRDDGPGIPPEVRDRIFEPFYTTKEEGTGLGLPVVQRIVAAHGGEVTIESESGWSTVIAIRLPMASP